MITCPICGVYWDYVSKIPPNADDYTSYQERYKLKEQGDCICHVANEHLTMLLAEMLENKIQSLLKLYEDLVSIIYFDNKDIIKTHQYKEIKKDLREMIKQT